MSDELDILRRAPTPAPSEAARSRALDAAMLAFDEAHAPVNEKGASPTQGTGEGLRHRSVEAFRNALMHANPFKWSRPAMATALALTVIPTGAYLAIEIMEPQPRHFTEAGTFGSAGTRSAVAPAPSRAPRVTAESDAVAVRRAPASTSEGVAPAAVPFAKRSNEARFRAQSRHMNQSAPRPVIAAEPMPAPVTNPGDVERYPAADDRAFRPVAEAPVSTFSTDVDTASYARIRRAIMDGSLPPRDMVRVEELVNYFDYAYPLPETRERPFGVTTTLVESPWNAKAKLLHIGIKGFDVVPETRPRANLVFLIDTSGSMRAPDKLPLLVRSFRLLLTKLQPDDMVSIVTYAGSAGTALEPTKVSDRAAIEAALSNLAAGGSTAGAAGIERAYELAERSFVKGGVNRVMLATDGDFNVGLADPKALERFVAEKRDSGVFLSVLGFGRGNLRDDTMQSLAQNGNGVATYIDTLAEARKVLVEEAGATLFPIAKDVKVQVEFNPGRVSEYRLIGYETRALKREDFNDDTKDAGDIGSGHSVTAIYEYLPKGETSGSVDALRYGDRASDANANPTSDEIAFVKLRYKLPDEDVSKLVTTPVAGEVAPLASASDDVRFSTAVAAFGQKLRGNRWLKDTSFEAIADLAAGARGEDANGYRNEFLRLVKLADSLAAK